MPRLHPTLALAAALWFAGSPAAAQVSPSNPFAIERAEQPSEAWHPRHEHHRRHEGWRLERRGERLQRHGDRIERKGRRWERHGERLERCGERGRLRRHTRHHGAGNI